MSCGKISPDSCPAQQGAPMSAIHLKKWYLDCVDDNGAAFIGYSAELRWHALHLHYESCLHYSDHTGIATDASFLRHSFPVKTDRSIEWNSRPLHVRGIWKGICPSIHRKLYESEECTITWECFQPHSHCTIQADDRCMMSGSGYAECLEIELAEWALPFDGLRWGRFLSGDISLVWIDWTGRVEQHLMFWNGTPVHGCTIDDDRIAIPERDAILTLHRRAVLKDASILSPALRKIPGLSSIIPPSLARSQEIKWLSKGTLTRPRTPDLEGWAIHERVTFQ
jgi:hypothetical protein